MTRSMCRKGRLHNRASGGCWRTEANASAAKKCNALHTSASLSQSAMMHLHFPMHWFIICTVAVQLESLWSLGGFLLPISGLTVQLVTCAGPPAALRSQSPTRCTKMQADHPKGTQCWGRPADAGCASTWFPAGCCDYLVTLLKSTCSFWAPRYFLGLEFYGRIEEVWGVSCTCLT